MELNISHQTVNAPSKKALWTGRIISMLCVLFLLVDAIMKMIRESHSVEGTIQLGWPAYSVQSIGIILLACTVLYLVPRTAILGAILLTGFLGGAIATMARIGQPIIFPLIFGILVWCGLFLRDEKLRKFIPLRKEEENI